MSASPLAELARMAADTGQPLRALVRRHAMDGLLRRVAWSPEAGELVLRGSLMTRLWVRPAYRPAHDMDFVTTYPFDPARATATIRSACGLSDVRDGLVFRPEAIRDEITWSDTPFPGTRFRIPALLGEEEVEVQVDVGYDDPLVPPPLPIDYATLLLRSAIRVMACRPELGFAWKVHGLFESSRWRAKDLHDIHLMVRNTPMDRVMLVEGLRVAFESRRTPLTEADRLFGGEFGWSRGSRLKWQAFRRERSDPSIPSDHLEAVRMVAEFLQPLFRDT